jgi:hypothetical protein
MRGVRQKNTHFPVISDHVSSNFGLIISDYFEVLGMKHIFVVNFAKISLKV